MALSTSPPATANSNAYKILIGAAEVSTEGESDELAAVVSLTSSISELLVTASTAFLRAVNSIALT